MADPNQNEVQGLKAELELSFGKFESQLQKMSAMLDKTVANINRKLTSDTEKAMAKSGMWAGIGRKTAGEFASGFRREMTPQFDRIGSAVANTMKRALMAPFAIAKSIATLPFKLLTSPLAMIGGAAGIYGIGRAAGSVINAGRDLQSEQVEIQKTTDLTDASIGKLTQSFLNFSNATGVARSQLMSLSAIAGRLGIKDVENLDKFAQTFIKAATATNVTPDMAEGVLRTMNAMGEGVGSIDRIMSAVNELGNNLATNEQRILNFVGTMPFVKQALKMTTAQFLGLAGAAATTANEESLTGTALTNLSIAMLKAVEKPGKELLTFAQTAGMSMKEFARLIRDDANEAMIRFLEGVKRVGDEGGSLVEIFNNMGQDGARLVRVVTALSLVTDDIRRAQRLAGDEMERNTSLTAEFEKRVKTVAFQQQRVTEIFRNFFATLNNNALNTDLFRNLADSLLKILDANKLQIAQGFQGALQRITELMNDLPRKIEQAKIAFKGLFTDPAYLEGVLGKIGKVLATTLIEGFKALISFVAFTADILVKPILEALARGLAMQFAGTPVIGAGMTNQAARGFTRDQLVKALFASMPADQARLLLSSEASGMQGAGVFMGAHPPGGGLIGANPPSVETFLKYVIGGMTGKQRESFVGGLNTMLEDPTVRAQRDVAMRNAMSGRSAQAISTFETNIVDAAGNVKKALDELAAAARGKGTATGSDIAAAGMQHLADWRGYLGTSIMPNANAVDPYLQARRYNGAAFASGTEYSQAQQRERDRVQFIRIMLDGDAAKLFRVMEESVRETKMADKS